MTQPSFRPIDFDRHGEICVTFRLSASPQNLRAGAYDRKHGWPDLGPRPGREKVHLLELNLGDVVG